MTRVKTTLRECYDYRGVLSNMLSQYLKMKYKRTFLGYIWSLLNPVLQLIVLTAVFSHVVRLEMKDYTLYLFSGLLAWTFFSISVTTSATALLESENFIKKIYLPKMIFPLSKVLLAGVDFLFSVLALSLVGLVVGFKFHATILLLPFAIFLLFTFALGLSLIFSVATVYFRDVQYLLGVFLNLAYFATPVIYPLSALPERFRTYMMLNPLAVQVGLFQKIIYAGEIPTAAEWSIACALSLVALTGGMALLSATEEDLVFRM